MKRAAPAVHELRACQLCTHHGTEAGELVCRCPIVAGSLQAVPCVAARREHGGCGPDALHLDYPATQAPLLREARPMAWATA